MASSSRFSPIRVMLVSSSIVKICGTVRPFVTASSLRFSSEFARISSRFIFLNLSLELLLF